MTCARHPMATAREGRCPACLFEEALRPDGATSPRRLTVHLPLGMTRAGSVFLVRPQTPSAGLLRLKTWYRSAPPDFLDRFHVLQQELAHAAESAVAAPMAASVDASGWPSVLTEFRRGMPILQAVGSGAVTARAARDLLGPVRDLLHRVRAGGLTHGSMVAGNVFVRPDVTAAFLVDFGLSALLRPPSSATSRAEEDETALNVLIDALRAL